MDIYQSYCNYFKKAFEVNESGELIVNDNKIHETKRFLHRWGFLIQMLLGTDEQKLQCFFTTKDSSRNEMDYVYSLGHVVKVRMEALRDPDFIKKRRGISDQ